MIGEGKFWQRLIGDRVVLCVIAINALALVLRGFSQDKDGADHVLFWVEYGCTLFFLVEFAIKVRTLRWRGYWSNGWNRVDACIVLASSPLLLVPFIDLAEDVALLLLLRVGRLARLGRLLTFIPDRDRLWRGISRSLRAVFGVSLALALYCFLLGLAACHLFHDLAPAYFGDPAISLYSMFKVFTVEGWYEIPDSVAEHAPFASALFIRLFFMGSVVTGGLLGLSLVNAIFVDEMVMDNNEVAEHQLVLLGGEIRSLREEMATAQAQILALLARPAEAEPGRPTE